VVSIPAPRVRGLPPRTSRTGGRPARWPGARTRPLVAASVLALAAGVAAGWGAPPALAVAALAATVALAELVAACLPRRAALPARDRWASTAVEAAAAAALVLRPGGWVPVAAIAGSVLAHCVLARLPGHPPMRRVLLPLARLGAGSSCAAAVTVGTGRLLADSPVVAAAAGMLAWWAVAHVLTVLSVASTTGRRVRRLLARRAPQTFTAAASAAAIGITSGWLAEHAPAGLLGLLAPVGLLAGSARQAARESTQAALFTELARGRAVVAGVSVDDSAGIAVTAAARLLGGADVELVLLGEEGAVRYAGTEHGRAVRARVDPGAFDEPWLLRALGSGLHGVRSGVECGRPVLTALVGTPEAPLAALVARRPVGATTFGPKEVALAVELAVQTATWLTEAGGGALIASAGTVLPALAVLRESALRLAGLASPLAVRADGREGQLVRGVVGELQVLERAVASVIGSLATGGTDDTVPVPAANAATDADAATDALAGWTSSGVLAP